MIADRDALLHDGARGPQGDPSDWVVAADRWLSEGELELAAAALDRAYGLSPADPTIAAQRLDVLDRLQVIERGIAFRYVPAGTFVMGSTQGDPDERPAHPVLLDGFWISDTPIDWASFCQVLGWPPPPRGMPDQLDDDADGHKRFMLAQANKIRSYYCSSAKRDASWEEQARELMSTPNPYGRKPMVAVGWKEAELFCEALSSPSARFSLPTEAQWEKAARGGLIGKRYSWGDEPPDPSRCDFDHFGEFWIAEPRTLLANGYGLYGMCGGVWEWTASLYDALAYSEQASGKLAASVRAEQPDSALLGSQAPTREVDPALLEVPHLRVLRGGSWTDPAEAVTVSRRMAREGWGWFGPGWSEAVTPNIGFRVVRTRA